MSFLDFLVTKDRGTDLEEIFGTKVSFMNEDPHSFEVERIIETNFHLLTLAASEVNEIKIEDMEFKEQLTVYIVFPMHRTIFFPVNAKNLKELVSTIAKIYVEIFKNYSEQATICCGGYESLYIKKIRFHVNNIISLGIEYINLKT